MQVKATGYGPYAPASAPAKRTAAKADDDMDAMTLVTGLPEPEKESETTDIAAFYEAAKEETDTLAGATQSAAADFGVSVSKPTDNSGEYTRRLVAAKSQFAVRDILTNAHSDLVSMRMVAAMTVDKEDAAEARACIKRLEKLVRRGNKKIRDLDSEDGLKMKETRAKQERKLERVREIKAELRRERMKRLNREQGYLLEQIEAMLNGRKPNPKNAQNSQLDATSEAAIEAQAQMRATAEITADIGTGTAELPAADSAVAGDVPTVEVGEVSDPLSDA